MSNTTGERVKALREQSGLTQEALAERISASRITITRIESGAGKQYPTAEVIVALADFFGVSIDYILGRTDVTRNEVTSDPPQPSSDLDALPPDLRAKAKEYIAMLKLLDESRKKDSAPTGTDDIPKHA